MGRKIVVDAVGSRAPVGGGAFSGKDPTKVDRSAAYQARQIAKSVLANNVSEGQSCLVTSAYGIGQFQAEAFTAIIDGITDVTDRVRESFPDFSPGAIQERLGFWEQDGWTYAETAAFGHFGHDHFPWEATISR